MKMELMVPAGNVKSFLSAIQNGADAVYLGLKKFNARKPADNFSIYQLKKVLNIAHSKNIKIYLAINIDLRSNELKEAAQILELVKELKIDAVIAKDPAIIYLIKNYYSTNIDLHLSTQTSICSSYGVKFAGSQGAKRVVLARELELDEIGSACDVEGIECEIFVEGSMCFSISGRCLMSSWVGGKSGNRGSCTAPCRVLWTKENSKYPYFSMKDLSLINSLYKLSKINVSALKIEGRLKDASWVGIITGLYHKALNDKENNIEASFKDLQKYSAREISHGHIPGHSDLIGKNENWGEYQKIRSADNNEDLFAEKNSISFNENDGQINIIFKIFDKSSTININIPPAPKKAKLQDLKNIFQEIRNSAGLLRITNIHFNNIDIQFSSSFLQKIIKTINDHIRDLAKKEEDLPDLNMDILEIIHPKTLNKKRDKLLGDLPDKIIISSNEMHNFLSPDIPIRKIVISMDEDPDLSIINKLNEKYELILSIPPVLYEKEAKKMHNLIVELNKNGFDSFEANSYSGIEMLNSIKCSKYLGIDMPAMNHLAAEYFYGLGFLSLYSSIESDVSIYRSLSNFCSGNIESLVFGKPVLFRSRVGSEEFYDGASYKDKFNIEVNCVKQKENNLFTTKSPFSLLGKKIKNENINFDHLTADLRYFKDPLKTLKAIFNGQFHEDNSSSFNFFKRLS